MPVAMKSIQCVEYNANKAIVDVKVMSEKFNFILLYGIILTNYFEITCKLNKKGTEK